MQSQSAHFPQRRRFERKPYAAMVAMQTRGEFSFEGARQISEGGMLIEVHRTLLIGDIVQLWFFGPVGEVPMVKARVVYHLRDEQGNRCVGVSFEEINPRQLELIRLYVKNQY